MPIYEYRCEGCGETTSALLPRFDSPDPSCPSCGEPRLRRLVSTFATAGGDDDLGGDFGGGGEGADDPGPGADDFADDDW
jgi:putative FmdB family regulatory protein